MWLTSSYWNEEAKNTWTMLLIQMYLSKQLVKLLTTTKFIVRKQNRSFILSFNLIPENYISEIHKNILVMPFLGIKFKDRRKSLICYGGSAQYPNRL